MPPPAYNVYWMINFGTAPFEIWSKCFVFRYPIGYSVLIKHQCWFDTIIHEAYSFPFAPGSSEAIANKTTCPRMQRTCNLPAYWLGHTVVTGSRYCCFAPVPQWFCVVIGSQVKRDLVGLVMEDYDITLRWRITLLEPQIALYDARVIIGLWLSRRIYKSSPQWTW